MTGDGGQAASAALGGVDALAVDNSGNIYFSQPGFSWFTPGYGVIRMISATGVVSSIAGTGKAGLSGDGGAATSAQVSWPSALSVNNATGEVYVADVGNHRIRMLSPNAPDKLDLVGGDGQTGTPGRPLANPLTVKVMRRPQVGVAGVSVLFSVTSGTATFIGTTPAASTINSTTDSTGLAAAGLDLGTATGPITVTATLGALPAVQFTITSAAAPNADTPVVATGGVAGAGGSVPAVAAISPNCGSRKSGSG